VNATLDDYRWLVSDAARPWLELARDSNARTVPLVQRLRNDLTAAQAHLVVEQVELRARARPKFSRSQHMFFTARGLEQATDEQLAYYKASRFPQNAVVLDLCCGIGGDLLSLADRGPATGIDLDPASLVVAAANLRLTNRQSSSSSVQLTDASQAPIATAAAWHCDPDRRTTGRRTTTLEYFSPPLEALDQLLKQQPSAAIKLAPATQVPEAWAARGELQWLGSRGECRQQVAWFGALARHSGQRAATIVESQAKRTVIGSPTDELPNAAACGRYIYEPHAAVLAARLTAALCREHALAALSPNIAYLTGDAPLLDAALDAFEVRDMLPFDRKRLKAYCRQHNIGCLEVKKRGVDIEPNRLARQLASSGDERATILVAPIGGQVMAIVTRRIHTT
jgi:hypothetical protein